VKVRFTGSAEADLERIGDRIAENSPERARLTVRALRATSRSIGAAPYLWSPVVPSRGVRKKLVRPYVVLYTITAGEVVILRIAHERSDWASLV
jgi:plasmid stabilization system protein ParE